MKCQNVVPNDSEQKKRAAETGRGRGSERERNRLVRRGGEGQAGPPGQGAPAARTDRPTDRPTERKVKRVWQKCPQLLSPHEVAYSPIHLTFLKA